MNAHWLNDAEQVLVTGTLDPGVVVAYLRGEDLKARAANADQEYDVTDMLDFVEGLTGQAQRGSIVPANPYICEGYTWFWKASANGRCKAVVFG